jgi:hypothetical protein
MELEILVCPYGNQAPAPGFTSYRGPAKPVADLAGGDPVGCCEPGNHPSGTICVLLKNGDVFEMDSKDPRYAKALAGTAGAAKK